MTDETQGLKNALGQNVPLSDGLDGFCPPIRGVSRDEWHDKAWALFHAKTFDDTMLHKVNMHTIRAVFNATYDALFVPSNAELTGREPQEQSSKSAASESLRLGDGLCQPIMAGNKTMNTQDIEQEIQDKGLNAPRVTPARVEEVIVGEDYHIFPETTLMVCCLKLENGVTVFGESACASPENFDIELGRKIARVNAKKKIWALEGYALREKLAGA
jgi:Phage protein (N4 Gp49/phage Sf6 gene 66) family